MHQKTSNKRTHIVLPIFFLLIEVENPLKT